MNNGTRTHGSARRKNISLCSRYTMTSRARSALSTVEKLGHTQVQITLLKNKHAREITCMYTCISLFVHVRALHVPRIEYERMKNNFLTDKICSLPYVASLHPEHERPTVDDMTRSQCRANSTHSHGDDYL